MLYRSLVLMAVVLLPWLGRAADDDPRIRRSEDDLVNARALAASVTNAAEKLIWDKRVELSEKELANIRRRIELEAREKALLARRSERATLDRLRELLRAVETDTRETETQITALNASIRRLQSQREDMADRLVSIAETQMEDRVEFEQRIQNADAETRARVLERDAADLKLRLAHEAQRIDQKLREQELSPRPTIGRLLDLRRQRDAVAKNCEEAAAMAAVLQEQLASVKEALTLNEERLGHLNEEIQTLENLYQVVRPSLFSSQKESPEQAKRRKQIWQMLSEARSQLRWLQERVKHRNAQLAALQQSIVHVQRVRDLASAEQNNLQESFHATGQRLIQRVSVPLSAILGLLLLSFVLRRLVLPLTLRAENLFLARRAISYVTGMLGIAVLALFFLEDLKAIATILGIAGAAVVIALQDLCSAFAGWFVIIASRKVQVGDRIEVDNHRGDVVDIQLLRTTMLEVGNWMGSDDSTGRIVIIPNSYIFKSQVFNYSHGHPFIWGKVEFTLTFESPIEQAQALFERVLREETLEEFEGARKAATVIEKRYGVSDAVYEPRVLTLIRDSGVHFSLYFVAHYRRHEEVRHRVTARLLRELEQHPALRIAYPTQRELHEPNPMSYSKGQHGHLPPKD